MSARKWPIYTMQVGGSFIVENPPSRFATYIWRYGDASGKRFSCRRMERGKADSPKVVRRLA